MSKRVSETNNTQRQQLERKKFGPVQFNKPEWLCVFGFPLSPSVLCCYAYVCCCIRFHSCSFVCTTRILNVNVFQTNKWQPTCMKWAQHIQKQAERFLLFFGFFVSIFLSLLLFVRFQKKEKKSWAYDRFPNFSLRFFFSLLYFALLCFSC